MMSFLSDSEGDGDKGSESSRLKTAGGDGWIGWCFPFFPNLGLTSCVHREEGES